jgi:hypothetical protein
LLSAKRIPPGKSGQIEVKIKTEDYVGDIEKQVRVKTNDPQNSEVTLIVKAIVEQEVQISESGIFFGSARKGKEVRKDIILTVPAGKPIEILGAESRDSAVAVKIEPVSGSGGKNWKLTAIQKADAKTGFHYGKILVKTNSRLSPIITIYERGEVTAPGK